MQTLSGLPMICIIFWFNAYLIIKVFSFSTAFVERFSGLGDFVFNYISPTMDNGGEATFKMFRARSKSKSESVKNSSQHWSHETVSRQYH